MLIELDNISGNGATITFSSNDDCDISQFIIARPKSLPLKKRPLTFRPTLPTTPENEILRGCNIGKEKKEKKIVNSEVYEFVKKNTDVNCNETKSINACYDWLAWRWRKFFRKSTSIDRMDSFSDFNLHPSCSPVLWHREKENKRDWGEERHNDVIYKVVLKKVQRISDPTSNESEDGLQYVTEKARCIKGASLSYLVGLLWRSQHEESDLNETNYPTVFFSTYRSFATPAEVLDQIEKQSEKMKDDSEEKRRPVSRTIVRILRTWLERFFEQDFYAPPKHHLLQRLCSLAEDLHEDTEEDGDAALCDDECDFLTFVKSKLQLAEVKSMQEQACQKFDDTYSDIHLETEEISVDDDSSNTEATRTFLANFSAQTIAEQLTILDANLFASLIPHHCLKCVRSSKEKPATVKATIDQFNRVVFCVLGTCLAPNLKMSQRVKVLSKWIEIAKACREMRNFSSLHAIVSGLKAHPIHRLKRTWQQVSSANTAQLDELSRINIKDVLFKSSQGLNEKLASSSRVLGRDSPLRRNQTLFSGGVLHGTVPYLGWFLTDLTYLHTAKPDYIEKKIINFSKMKKEFEMLAQLQLWQASCRSFKKFMTDDHFSDWFNAVTLPTNEQANQLSEEIESPHAVCSSPGTPVKRALSDILAHQMLDVGGLGTTLKPGHKRNSSNELSQINSSETEQGSPDANGHAVLIEKHSNKEERIVSVQIIKKNSSWNEINDPDAVKEIKLSSNDRSPAFIKKVLSLFEIEENKAKDFQLLQILENDKELRIPDNGNVFYAMNSSSKGFHFTLLESGAEIKRNKPDKTRTLPLSGKKKKNTRKTFSVSSFSTSGPTKKNGSIYRHLGMGGMTLATGSFSGFKEEEKQDSDLNKKSRLSPELGRRKKADEGVLSSCTNSSNDESADETSGLKRKMKKLMGKSKGHRRNHSYSSVQQSQNPRTGEWSLSLKLFQSPFDTSRNATPGSCPSDSDNEQATAISPSDSFRSNEEESPALSKPTKTQSKPILRKRESRSKFYVPAIQLSDNSDSVNSQLDEGKKIMNISSRTVSCPADYSTGLGENGVHGEGHTPVIRVECPSPEKSLKKPNFESTEAVSSDSGKPVLTNRRRVASETRTTAL